MSQINKAKKQLFKNKLLNYEEELKSLTEKVKLLRHNMEYIKNKVLTRQEVDSTYEIIHKKMESGVLKGFTLCNDPDSIFKDILRSHDSNHNKFGIFYNNEGRAIEVYEFTSCGYCYMVQGSAESRFADLNKNKVVLGCDDLNIYDNDFDVIGGTCDIEDREFDYKSALRLLIIRLCELGFMYLPKKTMSGKSQYDKSGRVVNEDDQTVTQV